MTVVLVTGAAGFIGSHVAEALLKRGATVVGVDNLNDYYNVSFKEKNLEILSASKGFKFEKLDLSDEKGVKALFTKHGVTHVAHLAARAGVRPSIENPFIYEESNVRGTLNLLDAARLNRAENFVLTSSSSVYGNSKAVPFKEDDAATDKPISPYAASKKSTEVFGYTFHSLYKLNVSVVRPFTVYGPRGRPDMAPWLFIHAAINGTPIKKFGDGSTRRDYTYIDDFVAGFVEAVYKPQGYEIFNLGNSATVSLNQAIETIEKVTGKTLKINQLPPQQGDVDLTNADISKAERLLGYKPAVSFAEGMKRFYHWFVSSDGPGI